jgi:hypothetical protein
LVRALELLAFVAKSPLSWHAIQQKAAAALPEMESALPPEEFAAAVARGEARSLDDVIAEILAEKSPPQ